MRMNTYFPCSYFPGSYTPTFLEANYRDEAPGGFTHSFGGQPAEGGCRRSPSLPIPPCPPAQPSPSSKSLEALVLIMKCSAKSNVNK